MKIGNEKNKCEQINSRKIISLFLLYQLYRREGINARYIERYA